MDISLPRIVGNGDLLTRIKRDVMSSSLSHAYIIEGPYGSGKHTLAKYISLALSCIYSPLNKNRKNEEISFFDMFDEPAESDPDGADDRLPCCFGAGEELCPSCRKLLEGKSPDIYLIGRDGKASIGIETVRNLKDTVYLAPIDGESKIYIIEDADTMTTQAQNALLLTLEEPPPYVLFLLLCTSADGLLETIRSRAPRFRTEPIRDDVMRDYIISESRAAKNLLDTAKDEFDTVILSSDGCIGKALDLLDVKARRPILQRRAAADAFIECCIKRRAANTFDAINMFGTKRDEASEILECIKLALRDLLLLKKSENITLKYYTDFERAIELSDSITSDGILTVFKAVENASYSFERNGNVRLTLMRMCVETGLL